MKAWRTSVRIRSLVASAASVLALVVTSTGAPAQQQRLPNNRFPSFSRDGSSILYTSMAGGSITPIVMNVDGSSARPVTIDKRPDGTVYIGAGWFRDGSTLLAASSPAQNGADKGLEFHQFLKVAANGSWQVLAAGINIDRPSLSPDERQLVFEAERGPYTAQPPIDLIVYTIATLTQHVITDGRGQYIQAAYAPDAKTIAFACKRAGDAFYQICLINSSGSGYRTITHDRFDHEYPSWSPDSKRLLFFSEKGSGATATATIGEIDIATRKQRTLTPDNGERNEVASWSPDGRLIVFQSAAPDRGTRIAVMNADGTNIRILAG